MPFQREGVRRLLGFTARPEAPHAAEQLLHVRKGLGQVGAQAGLVAKEGKVALVGAVIGVGLARGIGALDVRVFGKILVSWVATLPISASLSIFFYFFFKGLLSP